MTEVTIASFTYTNTRPSDFVPTEPPPTATLVRYDSAYFPWDLPYVWEEQKDLGWPSEIAEADDPLSVFLSKWMGFYDPLALVPDEDREYWHAILNSVLRRPGGFIYPDDYDTVGRFVWGVNCDPTNEDWWDKKVFASILEDAHALQAILDKYNATDFVLPAPPPSRGRTPDPDKFWAHRARQEEAAKHEGRWKQERENTRSEYRRLYPSHASTYTSKAPLDAYVRQMIYQARERLGLGKRRKKS